MGDFRNLNIKIKSKPFLLSKTDQSSSEKLNFNINSITKKQWILENFEPNNHIMNVKRGRQELEPIYSKVGRPSQLYPKRYSTHHPNTSNLQDLNKDNCEYLFDNLRYRSKSPPDYGRINFPSTQECNEDKGKLQRINYEKTLYRFYTATNYMILPFEREFLFRKDLSNRILEDINFTGNETDPEIYVYVPNNYPR